MACSAPLGGGKAFPPTEFEEIGRVRGGSLLKDASPQGRALRHRSGFIVLEYEAKNGRKPLRTMAGEVILIAKDSSAMERLVKASERAKSTHSLRPTIVGRIPGKYEVLVRALGPGLHSPDDVLSALALPSNLANGVEAYPNGLIEMLANQDLLDPGPSERQWSLFNPGIFGGHPTRADADADGVDMLARMRSTGPVAARDIVVAVLDTGVDPGHEALGPALWRNPHEIPGNGTDDDRNGYVDDVFGWNFGDGNNDVRDWDGHGTHVAGIVAARRPLQPEKGSWGIAPFAKVLTVKIPLNRSGFSTVFVVDQALAYVTALGADVVNMSFGTDVFSPPMRDAVWTAARTAHMVAAAGNDGLDLSKFPYFPCSFARVVCVVSTTRNDDLAGTSNYDPRPTQLPGEVHHFIAAPGDEVLSTYPSYKGAEYRVLSGTSMAAPLVSGTLAAVEAMHPKENNADHIMRLLGNSDRITNLRDRVDEGRRLNAYQAVYGPVVGITRWDQTEYCLSHVTVPHNPAPVPRWKNRPYANSGEPGINGSFERPFTVCNVQQLSGIRDEDLGRVFALKQHIFWEPNYYPIGGSPRVPGQGPLPFRGMLQGNGYSIYNLRFEGVSVAGLFAHLGRTGQVLDLHLRNVDLRATGPAGAVAPISEGRIVNVHVDARVEGQGNVGGLVGTMPDGLIDRAYFAGEVKSVRGAVGGLAGTLGPDAPGRAAQMRASQARAVVIGTPAGGLAGVVQHGALIEGSYAWTNLSSGQSAGGVAGIARCDAQISGSYSEGTVAGSSDVGGVVGTLSNSYVTASYASVMVSGGKRTGGVAGSLSDRVQTPVPPVIYLCTRTAQVPPPSKITTSFYNSFLFSGPDGGGIAATPRQLRSRTTFPGWFDAPQEWHFEEGHMPVRPGLARSWEGNTPTMGNLEK